MKPHALILVPEEGDPHGLLAEGVCGARPPCAARPWNGSGHYPEWVPCDEDGHPAEDPPYRALVLAWDGELVPHGRPWVRLYCRRRGWLVGALSYLLGGCFGSQWRGYVSELNKWAVERGLTLIAIDADGQVMT